MAITRKIVWTIALSTLFVLSQSPAAEAQVSQSLSLQGGYFMVRGEDGRIANDVLVADLSVFPPLAFDINDFNGGTIGAEWLIGFGPHVETGLGLGFYRRTVPSVYRDRVYADGSEIVQDLKLRVVPFTATVRFLPLGRGGAFEPYLGAGVGVLKWRYSETGEFIDPSDSTIFRASFVGSGSETSPIFLGGARVPIGDAFAIGGELRYQKAEGTLPVGGSDGFLADKIDLGGFSTQFVLQFRF